jgi:hypothetical protein
VWCGPAGSPTMQFLTSGIMPRQNFKNFVKKNSIYLSIYSILPIFSNISLFGSFRVFGLGY